MPSQNTKYSSDWESEFKWLTKSSKSNEAEYYGYCKVCAKDIKISHGGKYDLMEHAKSTAHKQKSNAGSGCRKMEHFLTKPEDDLELAAMEATQTYHMLQENQSFASMECQTKIINTVFNVPKFQCANCYETH